MCNFNYDFRRIKREMTNNLGKIIDWDYKILFVLIDDDTEVNFESLNERLINENNIDSSIHIFMIHQQDSSMYCHGRNDIVTFINTRWENWFRNNLNWSEDFPNLQNEPELIYPRAYK